MDGRQRDREKRGIFYVIDPGHADLLWNRNPQLEKGFHDVCGSEIVCAHDRVCARLFHHLLDHGDVERVDPPNEMGLEVET